MDNNDISTNLIEKEILSEYFTLSSRDKNIISKIKIAKNKLGFAVFLKTLQYTGYPINRTEEISEKIIHHIADQLKLSPAIFEEYKWKSRTWVKHHAIIRKYTGFKLFKKEDYTYLCSWLGNQVDINPTRKIIADKLKLKCKELLIELPKKKEFDRLINASRRSFYNNFHTNISMGLNIGIYLKMDHLLSTDIKTESFNWLKSSPGILGMETILDEINKLKYIRSFRLDGNLFATADKILLGTLYNRCLSYDSFNLLDHKRYKRYSLLGIFLYMQEEKVIDNIVQIFLDLVRRLENSTEKKIEKSLVSNVRKAYNKKEILRKLTIAITDNPDGTIEEVILPKVDLETLKVLAEEFKEDEGDNFNTYKVKIMKSKFTHHYRRMLKPLLDVIEFKTNDPSKNKLIEGLKIVYEHIDKKSVLYPKSVKLPEEILTGHWKETAIEKDTNGNKRIKKYFFELYLLDKLEKNVKCKEIWVNGALRFRNPVEDLPSDWGDNRLYYYHKYKIPVNIGDFASSLKDKMIKGLTGSNHYFSKGRENEVYIFQIGKSKKGYFRVPKPKKQEEREILKEIKNEVISRWGIVDLLDILLEADKQIDFARFFHTTGVRQVLPLKDIRKRLLLTIFSLGTNMGLKRIHSSANPDCSYNDLLYFRRRFINAESLRKVISALTNKILKIRDTNIWGNTTAIASDGKQFGTWDQNLVADANPHYKKPGVMVYWHVATNAICIYSQIKNCNSSEVIAMIEGLVKHATDMAVESNYVDSRGKSEVAFAFCHFLGIDLMPRIKQIKKERLYTPDKEIINNLPYLQNVIDRPINWDLIYEQYDEMVKHIVAIKEGTGSTESILRRFFSYNSTNPTYKAFIELGKACKTIFLCEYLTNEKIRTEVHEGLNVIENWNSINAFIAFGSKMEFQTNDPQILEIIVLCLHLLQNAVILSNTIMMDKIINEQGFLSRMEPEDFKALTPLFTVNINPYGDFNLDLNKPSFLEVA
jgi:TnpA family transposase